MVATLMLHSERLRAKQPTVICRPGQVWGLKLKGLWAVTMHKYIFIYITYFLSCTAYDFGEGHLLQAILAVRTWFGAIAFKLRYCTAD